MQYLSVKIERELVRSKRSKVRKEKMGPKKIRNCTFALDQRGLFLLLNNSSKFDLCGMHFQMIFHDILPNLLRLQKIGKYQLTLV